jgi:prevent-host-death family protein
MKAVRIAELKARLSELLRAVRRGHSVTVLDRDTPVARIVPYRDDAKDSLSVRRHKAGAPATGRVRLPPPLSLRRDVVEFLLEERQGER